MSALRRPSIATDQKPLLIAATPVITPATDYNTESPMAMLIVMVTSFSDVHILLVKVNQPIQFSSMSHFHMMMERL